MAKKTTELEQPNTEQEKHSREALEKAQKALGLVALEPRILLDAAAVATGAEVISDNMLTEQTETALAQLMNVSESLEAEIESLTEHDVELTDNDLLALSPISEASSTQPQDDFDALLESVENGVAAERTEIVFVDSSIEGYQDLVVDIPSGVEIVILDSQSDGVEQIADYLNGREGIDAMHIISHGAAGTLDLGTANLNSTTIQGEYADEMAIINAALEGSADILIYGCDFGLDTEAVAILAEATGADIAASTDDTGASALGGDYVLETQFGDVDTDIVISAAAQAAFDGILAGDAPVLDLNSPANPVDLERDSITNFNQGDVDRTSIAPAANVFDAEGDDVQAIEITVIGIIDGSDETLLIGTEVLDLSQDGAFATTVLGTDVNVTYESGVITIAAASNLGEPIPVSTAEAIVQSIGYQNTAGAVSVGPRIFDIRVAEENPATTRLTFEEFAGGDRPTAAEIGADPYWGSDNLNNRNAHIVSPDHPTFTNFNNTFTSTLSANADSAFLLHITGGSVPAGQQVVFGRDAIPVEANTDYTISVDLGRENNFSAGPFEIVVNNLVIGSVSLTTAAGEWATYTFNFTTDATTTALDFELRNTGTNTTGNDFGIDNIVFAPTSPVFSNIASAVVFVSDGTNADVVAVNDGPIAVTGNISQMIDVVGNDVDPDADPLVVTGIIDLADPTTVIPIAVGDTVTLGSGTQVELLATGELNVTTAALGIGTETFDYEVSDGNGSTDRATVELDRTQGSLVIVQPTAEGIEDQPIPLGLTIDPILLTGGDLPNILGTAIGFSDASDTSPTEFTIPHGATTVRITGYGGNDNGGATGNQEEFRSSTITIDLTAGTFSGHDFVNTGFGQAEGDNFTFSDVPFGSLASTGLTTGERSNNLNDIIVDVSGNTLSISETNTLLDQSYLVEFSSSDGASTNLTGSFGDVQVVGDTTSVFSLPNDTNISIISIQGGVDSTDPHQEDKEIGRIIVDADTGLASGTIFSQIGSGDNNTAGFAFENYDINSGQSILNSGATIIGDATASANHLHDLTIELNGTDLTVTRPTTVASSFETLISVQSFERFDSGSPATDLGQVGFNFTHIQNANNPTSFEFAVPQGAETATVTLALYVEGFGSSNATNENTGTATFVIDFANGTTSGTFITTRANTPDLVSWTDLPFGERIIDGVNTTANHANIIDFTDQLSGALIFDLVTNPDGSVVLQGSAETTAHSGLSQGFFANYNVVGQANFAGRQPVILSGFTPGGTFSAGSFNPVTGTWEVNAEDLPGLTYSPVEHFSGNTEALFVDFNGVVQTTDIIISRVADAPALATADQSGFSNTDIDISSSVTATLVDMDGSETITTIELSNIPVGHTVSDGVNSFTATAGNQTVDIIGWDQTALTYNSSEGAAGDVTIDVRIVTTDTDNGISPTDDTAETTGSFVVTLLLDTDGDGVDNSVDIDDDNDGILDVDEGFVSIDGLGLSTTESTLSLISTNANIVDPRPEFNNPLRIVDGNQSSASGLVFNGTTEPNTDTVFNLGLNVIEGDVIDTFELRASVRNLNDLDVRAFDLNIRDSSGEIVFSTSVPDTGPTGTAPATVTGFSLTEGFYVVEFIPQSHGAFSASVSRTDLIAAEIAELSFVGVTNTGMQIDALFRDTDNDGIADHLDIDSDNDGITDNVEAQTTADYIAPSGVGVDITDLNQDGLDDVYGSGEFVDVARPVTGNGPNPNLFFDHNVAAFPGGLEANNSEGHIVSGSSVSFGDGLTATEVGNATGLVGTGQASLADALAAEAFIQYDITTADDPTTNVVLSSFTTYSPTFTGNVAVLLDGEVVSEFILSDTGNLFQDFDLGGFVPLGNDTTHTIQIVIYGAPDSVVIDSYNFNIAVADLIIPVDTDNDGTPDYIDSDSDNEGASDIIEGAVAGGDGSIPTAVLVDLSFDGGNPSDIGATGDQLVANAWVNGSESLPNGFFTPPIPPANFDNGYAEVTQSQGGFGHQWGFDSTIDNNGSDVTPTQISFDYDVLGHNGEANLELEINGTIINVPLPTTDGTGTTNFDTTPIGTAATGTVTLDFEAGTVTVTHDGFTSFTAALTETVVLTSGSNAISILTTNTAANSAGAFDANVDTTGSAAIDAHYRIDNFRIEAENLADSDNDGLLNVFENGTPNDGRIVNDGMNPSTDLPDTDGDQSLAIPLLHDVDFRDGISPEPPTPQDDDFASEEDEVVIGSLFADNGNGVDSDINAGDIFIVSAINGNPVTLSTPITLPSGALLTVETDGTFTYDPNGAHDALDTGEIGADSFTYQLVDSTGLESGEATVSFTLTGTNDAPIVDLNGALPGTDFAAVFVEDQEGAPLANLLTLDAVVQDAEDNIARVELRPSLPFIDDGANELLRVDDGPNQLTINLGTGEVTRTGPLQYGQTMFDVSFENGVITIQDFQHPGDPLESDDLEAFLRQFAYQNLDQNNTDGIRAFQFQVVDPESDIISTSTITVERSNDAPVATVLDAVDPNFTGTVAEVGVDAIVEPSFVLTSELISSISELTEAEVLAHFAGGGDASEIGLIAVSDLVGQVDSADAEGDELGIGVTFADESQGRWQYLRLDVDGHVWTDFQVGDADNTDPQPVPAGEALLFDPDTVFRFIPEDGVAIAPTLEFRIWDGTQGEASNPPSTIADDSGGVAPFDTSSLSASSFVAGLAIDTDGDGINNNVDVDDDNDGVLDVLESTDSVTTGADVVDGLVLSGSASEVAPDEILLTPASNNQAGNVMSTAAISLSDDFSLSFDVNLGTNDTNGADGIAFVFHADPLGSNASGANGRGLGAAGIIDGIALEFDTFSNTDFGDSNNSSNDHTRIWDTDTGNPFDGTSFAPDFLTPEFDLGNIEDGNYHAVTVNWDASNQTLIYTFDGVVVGTVTGDLVNDYFGGSTDVYYGFTASTGGFNNNQSVRFNDFDTGRGDIDSDLDGIVNRLDIDSDDDGITDNIEAQTTDGYIAPSGIGGGITDVNNDGFDDNYDARSTANGGAGLTAGSAAATFADTVVNPVDTDSQGASDYLDPDSDGDGVVDALENGLNVSFVAGDADNDGLADVYEAVLGDGNINDIGGFNVNEGITPLGGALPLDSVLGDEDSDAIAGMITPLSADVDFRDQLDTDRDGIADHIDVDDDNDGILDTAEIFERTVLVQETFGTGAEGTTPFTNYAHNFGPLEDGFYTVAQNTNEAATWSNWTAFTDHTGDFEGRQLIVNADFTVGEVYRRSLTVEANSDVEVDLFIRNIIAIGENDIPPNLAIILEDSSGNIIGQTSTGDVPEDEDWHNYILSINAGNNTDVSIVIVNNAPGGRGNDFAIDDITISQVIVDTDMDGVVDRLDIDSDNDGITDNVEAQTTAGYVAPSGVDVNLDGLDDIYDTRTGLTAGDAAAVTGAGDGIIAVDTDNDGTVDYLETNSDDEGASDAIEAGYSDDVQTGLSATAGNDTDGDGLFDVFERGSVDDGHIVNDGVNPSADLPDSDGDFSLATPLEHDLDYRDAIDHPDTDGDGVIDDIDVDDDNDGILDVVEEPAVLGTITTGEGTTSITGVYENLAGTSIDFALTSDHPINQHFALSDSGLQLQWNQESDTTASIELILQQPVNGELIGIHVGNGAPGNNYGGINVNNDITLTWPGGGTAVLHDPNGEITSHAHGAIITSGTVITGGGDVLINDSEWYLDIDLSNVTGPVTIGYDTTVVPGGGTAFFEGFAFNPIVIVDTDGDGIRNSLDIDSDNDGITDNLEAFISDGYLPPTGVEAGITDINNDGLDDNYDTRVGLQAGDAPATVGDGDGVMIANTDVGAVIGADATPDYLDRDSDGDGLSDTAENGLGLPDIAIGTLSDNTTDTDGDGLFDVFETAIDGNANDGFVVNEGITNLLNTGSSYLPDAGGDAPLGVVMPLTADLDFRDLNDDPVAQDDTVFTDADSSQSGSLLLDNGAGIDSDPDGDTVTVTQINGVANAGTQVTLPSGALLTVNPNGTYLYDPNGAFDSLLTGQTGTDSFTYTIDDGNGGTDTATVNLTVVGTNTVPVAQDDAVTTDEDTVLSDSVLSDNGSGADSDLDGDSLVVTEVNGDPTNVGSQITLPSGALLTLNSDGTYDYDPNGVYDNLPLGSSATDSFSYQISDGKGGFDTATVTITIDGVNDAPVAQDDAELTTQNGTVADSVLVDNGNGADSDLEGETLSVSAVNGSATDVGSEITLPSGATLTIQPDGTYIYDTNGAFNNLADGVTGTDSFTYTVSDPNGGTSTATVTLTVIGENDAPTASDDAITTPEDTPISDAIVISDVDGDTPTASLASGPTNGSVVVNPDGTYTYTPNMDYNGSDSFDVLVDDGNGGTVTVTVDVTVTPENDTPTTSGPLIGQMGEDGSAITPLDVTGAFDDLDGDTLIYSAADLPAGLSIDTNTGIISGTPDADASQGGVAGVYTATITAADPSGATITTTVEYTITNPAPDAVDDAFTATEGVMLSDNVITASDSDPDGDMLSISMVDGMAGNVGMPVAGSAGGQFTIDANGDINFDPNGDFNGLDVGETAITTITYELSDGEGGTDTATVTITVQGANDAPVVTGTLTPQTGFDNAAIIPFDASAVFSDPDGEALSFTSPDIPTWLSINPASGVITGTPPADASQGGIAGEYTFTIVGTDPDGEMVSTMVVYNFSNPAPIIDEAIFNQTAEDGETINIPSGFIDPDSDVVTYSILPSNPLPAGLSIDPATGEITGVIDSNASQGGDDPVNNPGVYTITVVADDGEGGIATDTFALTVTNPAPEAVDDTVTTNEEMAVEVMVLTNDSDPDGDTLTVSAITQGANGSVVIDPISGNPVYTPNTDFNGSDTFTYTIADGDGGTSTATVTVIVDPVNDAPDAMDDMISTDEDMAVTVPVLGNDSDTESNSLTVTAVTQGANGTVTIDPISGLPVYTPNPDYNGPDSFTYTIDDGQGGTDTATVNVTVNSVNDAPIAQDDLVTTDENTVLMSDVIADNGNGVDSDLEGTALTVTSVNGDPAGVGSVVTLPSGALLQLNPDGTYDYDPNGVFETLGVSDSVTDSFTYEITDADGGTDTATVTVTVSGVNDAPVVDMPVGILSAEDGDTLTIPTMISDVDGDTLTYSAAGLPAGFTIDPATGEITGTLAPNASVSAPYTIIVTADDGNGGMVTDTFDLLVTNPVPVVDVAVADITATDSEALTITPVISDPDGDDLTYSATGLPTGLVIDPMTGEITGTLAPNASQGGPYTVTVTADDGEGGMVSDDFVITVTNDAPVINDPVDAQNLTDSQTVSIPTNIVDPDGDALTYSATGLPAGLTIDPMTGIISGTVDPSASLSGPYSVVVTADDGQGGVVTDSFPITVTNPVPVVDTAVADQMATDGETVSISSDISDPDGDTLTYSVTGLPTGLSIDPVTGVISGTIDNSASQAGVNVDGVFTVTVTADDGEGGVITDTFEIEVANIDPVLVLSHPDVAYTDSEPVSFTPAAIDGGVDTDDLTYSATGLPAGLSIDPVTGEISGTIAADASTGGPASDGVYGVVVTADDGEGGTVSDFINVVVTNDAPVIAPMGEIADQGADDSTPVSITPSFVDPDGDTLTYSATNLPAGLSIDPVTGEISGTLDPSASQGGVGGVYTIELTGDDGQGGTVTDTFDLVVTNPAPVVDSPIADSAVVDGEAVSYTPSISDPDGDDLTYSVAGLPAGLSIDPTTGEITGTVDGSASQSGPYTVTVTATDADGDIVTDEFVIAVTNPVPVIDTPIADMSTEDNETVSITPSISDPDSDTLTYSATNLPAGLSIDPATGEITGTVDSSASQGGVGGVYTIEVTATDVDGDIVTDTFDLAVTNPAPVAQNDEFSVTEDEAPTILGNVITGDNGNGADVDADGDVVTVTDVDGSPAGTPVAGDQGGLFTILADGTVSFDPNGDFEDLDVGETRTTTVTYTVTDVDGASDTATVEIEIVGQNDAPAIVNPLVPNDPNPMVPDQLGDDSVPLTFQASDYFNDVDGELNLYDIENAPSWLSIDQISGEVTGTPPANASVNGPNNDGVYTITLVAKDFDGTETRQTVDFVISNPAPIATADLGVTNEDGPLITGNVITDDTGAGVDSDPDGDVIMVSQVDGVAANVGTATAGSTGGLFTINPDGSYSFDPNGDFEDLDVGETRDTVISYQISDGEGGFDTETVTITLEGSNDAPTPVDPSDPNGPVDSTDYIPAQGPIDDSVALTPLDTSPFFTDVDGEPLTFTLPDAPSWMVIDPVTGVITGTPPSDASQGGPNGDGVYPITITVTDPDGESFSTVVEYTLVNVDPVVDTPISDVTVNDAETVSIPSDISDADGDVLEYSVTGLPAGLSIDPATGEITGTVDPSASVGGPNGDGVYTVTVTATDNEGGTITDTFELTAVNLPPVVDTPVADVTALDSEAISIETDISDPDGDTLTYTATGLPAGLSIDPATGEVTGTIDSSASQNGPNSDGVYTVTVTADDGEGGTVTDEFTIAVTNEAPVVSEPTSDLNIPDDVPVTIPSPITDPDGDDLDYTATGLPPGLTIDPSTGEITGTVDNSASVGGPNGDGVYTITVTADDGEGGVVSDTFEVVIANPAPVIDVPVEDAEAEDGTPVSITPNISDTDVDDLTYTATNLPEGLSIDPTTGVITGTIDPAASTGGPNGDGVYPITVTADDGEGGTVTDEFVLVVTNPAPVIDTPVMDVTLNDNTPVSITPDISDPDDDTLTYTVTGLPAGLSIDPATGEITGTVDGNASTGGPDGDGVYTVEITADDGQGGTVTDTFVFTATNPAPEATDDVIPTLEDTPVTANLLGNDSDVDGDDLSIDSVTMADGTVVPVGTPTDVVGGRLTVEPNGDVTFEPALNFNGPVTLDYVVIDSDGGTDTASVTIEVEAVNDGPRPFDPNDPASPLNAPEPIDPNDPNPPVDVNNYIPTQTGTDSVTQEPLDLTPYFVDPDGDPLTITIDPADLPEGLVFDGTMITGTLANDASQGGDPATPGTYVIPVTVTDADGETFTTNVTYVIGNIAPEVVETAETEIGIVTGEPVSIDASEFVVDPDGDDLTFSAENLPAGLSIDPDTGEITGIPEVEGVFEVTVTADDGNGGVVETVITLDAIMDGFIAPDTNTFELSDGPEAFDWSNIDNLDDAEAREAEEERRKRFDQAFDTAFETDLPNFLGGTVAAAQISGYGDGAAVVIEALTYDHHIDVQFMSSLDGLNSADVRSWSVTQSGGQSLPYWAEQQGDMLRVQKPLGQETLDLRVRAVLGNGQTVTTNVTLDLSTGQLELKGEAFATMQSLSDQLALNEATYDLSNDALVKALG